MKQVFFSKKCKFNQTSNECVSVFGILLNCNFNLFAFDGIYAICLNKSKMLGGQIGFVYILNINCCLAQKLRVSQDCDLETMLKIDSFLESCFTFI